MATTTTTSPPPSSPETADDCSPATENDEVSRLKGEGENQTNESKTSSKKRRSDIQLVKDGLSEGPECSNSGEEDDDDLNDEGEKRSDPFKRASSDILKNRKIIKASSKWSGGGDGGTAVGGTFASVKLTHTSTTTPEADAGPSSFLGSNNGVISFGLTSSAEKNESVTAKSSALFGSTFGSVSKGFGTLKSSSTSDNSDKFNGETKLLSFGRGFGSVSSGFGALKSSTTLSGFASAIQTKSAPSMNNAATSGSNGSFTGAFTSSSISGCQSQFLTPSVVNIDNGEKDEDCLCQVRAKLFKMVPETESAEDEEESKSKGDVPSVPSTTGRMELVKAKKCDEGRSRNKADDFTAGVKEEDKKQKLVQKEAGVGPVRVLKSRTPTLLGGGGGNAQVEQPSARVVQRQETSGGGATKVILNIRLDKGSCTVVRRGDKFVQLNAPNSFGAVESSLFKVKTTAEADSLEKILTDLLGSNGKDI